MNFSEMKRDIYESWKNGEITKDTAARLLISFESASIDHELDLAMEAVDSAETSFMESAVQYSNGNATQEVFEASAKSLGDKVKAAFQAFKKWVKDIIDKISKKILEMKAKLTGENQKTVVLKYDLKKLNKTLDDTAAKLQKYNPLDTWWKQLIGLVAGYGLVAITISSDLRDSLVNGIRASLLKISNGLDAIEAKFGDTQIIKVLRPLINLANKAIMAAYPAKLTKSDKKDLDEYDTTDNNLNNIDKNFAKAKEYADKINDLRQKEKEAYSRMHSADDIVEMTSCKKEIDKLDAEIKSNRDKMEEICSKYGTNYPNLLNMAGNAIGKYMGSRLNITYNVIRSSLVTMKKIVYAKPYDTQKKDIHAMIDIIQHEAAEFAASSKMVDVYIKAAKSEYDKSMWAPIKNDFARKAKSIKKLGDETNNLIKIAQDRNLI